MDASLQSTIAIRHADNGSRWAENMQCARITNYAEMLCKEAALPCGGRNRYISDIITSTWFSASRIAWDRLSFKLDRSSLGQTSIFQSFISRALTFMSVYKVL